MLHTIISYLSRFSRLVLLTFAFVVVLILVLFTINSATDDDISEVNDSAISAPAPESEVTTEQNLTYDETTGESLVIINKSSGATSTDTSGNPQTFTANSIDLDSGDTVTIVTTDSETQAALEAELENGHVSSTRTTLPSTGPASTIATALGLMALTGVGIAYERSKKNLSLGLLQINR